MCHQSPSPPSLLLSVPCFPSWGKGIKAVAGHKAAGPLRAPKAEVPCQKRDQKITEVRIGPQWHHRSTFILFTNSETRGMPGLSSRQGAEGQKSSVCFRPGKAEHGDAAERGTLKELFGRPGMAICCRVAEYLQLEGICKEGVQLLALHRSTQESNHRTEGVLPTLMEHGQLRAAPTALVSLCQCPATLW